METHPIQFNLKQADLEHGAKQCVVSEHRGGARVAGHAGETAQSELERAAVRVLLLFQQL